MRRVPHLRLLAALLAGLAAPRLSAEAPATVNEFGRLIVKNFTPRAYGGHPQTWGAAQDDAGVLYFGNSPGVLTYDGATWRSVAPEGNLTSCRGVVRGGDGKIYVGGTNLFGWLRPSSAGRHEFVSLVGLLPPDQRNFQMIGSLAAEGDAVYALCADRVLVWRRGRFTVVPTAPLVRLRPVGGVMYFQAARQPLMRFVEDRLELVSEDPVFLQNEVKGLGAAPGGGLLVATDRNAFFRLHDGRVSPWPTGADAWLRAHGIYRGWQLPDGAWALTHAAGGMTLLDADGRFRHWLDDTNGLMVARVIGVLPAREGGLWLTLGGGIAHVEWPAAITVFDAGNGLGAGNVNDVRRHDGTLYVAATAGLFRLAPGGAPPAGARLERLGSGQFHALLADERGLLAASEPALLELTPAGFAPTGIKLTFGAYALHRSRRDPARVWLAEQTGVRAARRGATGWIDEGRVPGLQELVRTLGEAPDGAIWGATRGNGFFRLTWAAGTEHTPANARVERFPGGGGLPAKIGFGGVHEWDGRLYFNASGSGRPFAFAEATRTFAPLPEIAAPPGGTAPNALFQAAENPAHLWVFTEGESRARRIYRADRGGGFHALPQGVFQFFSSLSVLREEPGAAGGTLWIGGAEGLLRVDPARVFPAATPYAAAVWADGVAEGGRHPHTSGALTFEFVAPRYTAEEPLHYETRLAGYEAEPAAWSPERRRSFTNLPEGAYRFEVRARDADGRLSAPAALGFTILPPWWRTWWAYAVAGGALGGAMFGLLLVRTRALRRKNEKLEQLVALRTEDLRRQNAELARLHRLELDGRIAARLGEEKARLEVLRYQLNPHFLFNALTSIRGQIPPVLAAARDTLDRLAEFCRLTLHSRKATELTTVGEELAMLRTYLDIEQTRLGELLRVTFDTDPALDAVPLPRLLLLPLVENALKYGHATSPDDLALKLTAVRLPDGLRFEVANTGEWVERGALRSLPSLGIGHDNLVERLLRHYPGTHEFTHSAMDGWVRVCLILRTPPA